MGTSLWLVPTAIQSARLKRAMEVRIPAKSPSSFVDFQPHVTLTTVPTSTDVSELLRGAIPDGQSAIPVSFNSVDVGDKYFMSVYVSVHDIGALAALRAHLRQKLGGSTVPPIAHISLYYIDNADAELRAQVAAELKGAGRVLERDGGVTLDCSERPGEGSKADMMEGFDGQSIWIVKCDGPVPGWEVLQKIPLA